MTNLELNRDIKRLWNAIAAQQAKTEGTDHKVYFEWIEKTAKPEYTRLFHADQEFTAMNLQSVKMMLRMNISHRIIPFHHFGSHIKI